MCEKRKIKTFNFIFVTAFALFCNKKTKFCNNSEKAFFEAFKISNTK